MLTFNQVVELPPEKRKDVVRQAVGILQRDPDNINALILGAAAYMGERNANKARQMLEKAWELNKKHPAALMYLVRLYRETNDHLKARESAAKLCQMDESNPQFRMIHGEVLQAASEMSGAIDSFKMAQQLGLKDPQIDARIGDC